MNTYYTLIRIVQFILALYWYVLIATAAISWIPDLADTQLGQILYRLTEPYLKWFRRYIPPVQLGGILLDLSFIVAIVVYYFVEQGVLYVLISLVRSML